MNDDREPVSDDRDQERAAAEWQPPRVAVIGFGMARSDLSQAALAWINRADVLAAGRRILDAFPDHHGDRIEIRSPIAASLDAIEEVAGNLRVAVLASGDPFFFGIGKALVERLGPDGIVALANITSVQALFARLKRPWQEVRTFSLHGRGDSMAWLEQVAGGGAVALFTDDHHDPAWIAAELVQHGFGSLPLAIGENLGLAGEAVRVMAAREARGRRFAPLNIVAVLAEIGPAAAAAESDLDAAPVMGIDEAAFEHRQGLITKREVRAVVLALLQLKPGQVLWDLGAGSGSIGIEACRLTPLLRVLAVERHPQRFRDLETNIKRFGARSVTPIAADALEAVATLPDPDRVFIGGSGGRLEPLLEAVRLRLRPGGRVVLTAVTLDTLHRARSFWKRRGWPSAVTQIQVSRSTAIGDSERLEALNPVFIVEAWPEPRPVGADSDSDSDSDTDTGGDTDVREDEPGRVD